MRTAVFSSWHGRHSDNPRAVSRELRRRGAPIRQVWVVPEDVATLPAGVDRVAPGSPDELAALEDAAWIVSNDVLPLEFVKRPGATYLQTWHGTPLKRIAYDVTAPTFPDAEYHYAVELGRDLAKWDVLVSPNAYSTEILRRAFRFEGEILETGYPRNDALLAQDREAVRARVRAALGLDPGALAVLYAPTWRDVFAYEPVLDAPAVHAALGDEVVLLLRAHGLTATNARIDPGAGARDVTSWPDIADLYLAADVLLTDYSSAMFDFAVTGKPLLFYTYDKDHYRDVLRGFYFDFEAQAPGPLLMTTDDVVAALRDVGAVARRHEDAYARFVARYCHHDDGHASERVVDAVFGRAAPAAPDAGAVAAAERA